jgi:hypothetical protein
MGKTNTYRKFPGKGGGKSRPDRMMQRQEDAKARNEAWASLSLKEKLTLLKARPGNCKKQIAKLTAKN